MLRLLAATLTFCVIAVLAAPFAYRLVGSEERAERLLADAQARAEAGDWVQARVRFEEALSADAQNVEARLGLARALRGGGLYEQAASHLLHIIDKAPGEGRARLELGEMLFIAGEVAESRAQLDAAIAGGAAGPRVESLAAAHAAVAGDGARARELAQAALEADPSLSQAYATLAALELRGGAIGAALEVLDRARAEGADTLSLGLLRLGLLERSGRGRDVAAELGALGALYPDAPELRLAQARWILGQPSQDAAEARGILADLLRRSADDPARTLALTGEMIEMLGAQGARAVFDAVAAEPGMGGRFENQIAVMEMAAGDRDAAIARLEREIAEGARAQTRNASRLLLARMLDPVEDMGRRVDLAEAVLATDPENPSAHLLLSDAQLRGGSYEDAISHLRVALTVRPDATDVILELARAHALAGSRELAQDRLSLAVRTSGHAPDVLLRYAKLVEARQGTGPAADLIDIGLESHPGNAGLLTRRAQLALMRGDLETARRMRARLAASPEGAEMVPALDLALTAQAEGPEAAIRRLLAQDRTGRGADEALSALSAAHLRQGRPEAALELLDGALGERPGWTAARLARADAHMAAGSYEAAEADLAAAAEALPERAGLQAALARLRLSLGDGEGADAAIAAGLAATPESYDLQLLGARRLEMAGETETALAGYRRLALRAPGDPRVAARLGLLLSAEGRGEGETAEALRITELLEGAADPALREVRAWVLHRAGQSARAASDLRALTAERPDDAVLLARLGLSEIGAGRAQEGRRTLARALALAESSDAPAPPGLMEEARRAAP